MLYKNHCFQDLFLVFGILKKMYQLNVPSPCHAYEDYVIEHVQQFTYGEYWHLGS